MKALKDFNARLHRFREGDPITPAHDLSPHDPADLQKRGFIGDGRSVVKPKSAPIETADSEKAKQHGAD